MGATNFMKILRLKDTLFPYNIITDTFRLLSKGKAHSKTHFNRLNKDNLVQ